MCRCGCTTDVGSHSFAIEEKITEERTTINEKTKEGGREKERAGAGEGRGGEQRGQRGGNSRENKLFLRKLHV